MTVIASLALAALLAGPPDSVPLVGIYTAGSSESVEDAMRAFEKGSIPPKAIVLRSPSVIVIISNRDPLVAPLLLQKELYDAMLKEDLAKYGLKVSTLSPDLQAIMMDGFRACGIDGEDLAGATLSVHLSESFALTKQDGTRVAGEMTRDAGTPSEVPRSSFDLLPKLPASSLPVTLMNAEITRELRCRFHTMPGSRREEMNLVREVHDVLARYLDELERGKQESERLVIQALFKDWKSGLEPLWSTPLAMSEISTARRLAWVGTIRANRLTMDDFTQAKLEKMGLRLTFGVITRDSLGHERLSTLGFNRLTLPSVK